MQIRALSKPFAALALTLAFAGAAHAQTAQHNPYAKFPVLNLSAQVREEVSPDRMDVILAVERSGTKVGAANEEVMREANKALAVLKRDHPLVQATIHQVQTVPVYTEKGKVDSWRVRATINVQGTDFQAVSNATQPLYKSMELVALNFSLTPEKRKLVHEEMRKRLAAEFDEKASATAQTLGYGKYRIQAVSLNETGGHYPMPRMFAMAKGAALSADAGIPTDAAKIEVTLDLSGSVYMLEK